MTRHDYRIRRGKNRAEQAWQFFWKILMSLGYKNQPKTAFYHQNKWTQTIHLSPQRHGSYEMRNKLSLKCLKSCLIFPKLPPCFPHLCLFLCASVPPPEDKRRSQTRTEEMRNNDSRDMRCSVHFWWWKPLIVAGSAVKSASTAVEMRLMSTNVFNHQIAVICREPLMSYPDAQVW